MKKRCEERSFFILRFKEKHNSSCFKIVNGKKDFKMVENNFL